MNVSNGWERGGELCEEGWAQSGGALDTGLGLGFIPSMMGRFWWVLNRMLTGPTETFGKAHSVCEEWVFGSLVEVEMLEAWTECWS